MWTNKTEGEKQEERPTRVLLVDDEPSIQRVLARRLRAEGYEVSTAQDGEEATHA